MKIIKPDFVLHEIAQRFIVGQPSPNKSIFDIAAEKLVQLPDAERARIKAALEAVSGNEACRQIAERTLRYLA